MITTTATALHAQGHRRIKSVTWHSALSIIMNDEDPFSFEIFYTGKGEPSSEIVEYANMYSAYFGRPIWLPVEDDE